MHVQIEFGASIDEESVFFNLGRMTLLCWYGNLSAWRLGVFDRRNDQNPHWHWYLGPFSIWWRAY